MAETYCGKNCMECTQKEELSCPGCKVGPGAQINGDCELARCCRTKGHETCETCNYRGNCGILLGRNSIPEGRLRKIAIMEREKAAIAQRAPVLGKWLWVMFWLFIPSEIAGIMTNESVTQLFPALSVPGYILQSACWLSYGLILLKISREEEMYRNAGICSLIGGAASVLITVLFGNESPNWSLLITLPAAVVGLVREYYEFAAHGNVLWGVDNELSDKWTNLWKWYIISYAALFGSLLVMVIMPIVGILIMIAGAIAVLVVGIMKLYYLYCTAKVFRTYDPAK